MKTPVSNYVIWHNISVPDACTLGDFEGLENTYPLLSGVGFGEGFPSDARFSMKADKPNNMLLTDSLRNTDSVLVGSPRLVEFFRRNSVPCVEYLPVRIIDHKKKPVKQQYHILHPIQPVDCIDRERSGVKYSKVLKTKIQSVKRLVLDESRVPPDRTFFRCRDFIDVTLVRRDFAQALDGQGFTGLIWKELDEYEP